MKQILLRTLFILCTISIVLYACKKDKPEPDTDTQSSVDNSMAEAEFMQVFDEVNNVGINEEGLSKTAGICTALDVGCNGCVDVTMNPCWTDTLPFPLTVTLDFGTVGCTGCDGKTRKGKLIVVFNDRWKNENAVATVTPQDYFVNDNQIKGEITFTNLTTGGIDTTQLANKPKVRIEVNDGISTTGFATIETPTGTIKWNTDKTIEQIEGHMTASDPSDDVFTVFGAANGVNRKGRSFTVNVPEENKLRKAAICEWVEDGILELTPGQLATRTVDFAFPKTQGNGVCDDQAQITVNGNTFKFTMD